MKLHKITPKMKISPGLPKTTKFQLQGMNCTFAGPGHGSVVEVGGDWWLVYHAWLYGRMNQDPGRMMLMDKVRWVDGWPRVGVPSDTPQPVPQLTNRWAGNMV